MSRTAAPHSRNAFGDFYVERDSCIACGAPFIEAPDLINDPSDGASCGGECYFKRQPESQDEIDRACSAIMVSCTKAVRYGGSDRSILKKLYDLGAYESVDQERSDLETRVADVVRTKYRRARKYGVHWTFTHEESDTSAIVACCFGLYPFILGIFKFDKTSNTIEAIFDDACYRPAYDHFRRLRPSLWWWQR